MDNFECSTVLRPIFPASKSGNRYVRNFFVMRSLFATIYPLLKKGNMPQALMGYYHDIKLEFDIDVKVPRCDDGVKYRIVKLENFCQQNRINQELTTPYNPEQNGMATRMNSTFTKMTRCMLIEAEMNKVHWCKVLMALVDIRNDVSDTSSPNASSFEFVLKRKSLIQHMRRT